MDERIRVASAAGFTGLDIPLDKIHTGREAEVVSRKLRLANLECGLFWLPFNLSTATEAQFQIGLDDLQEIAPIASRIGLKRTYCNIAPGSDTRAFDENREFHLQRLRATLDVLRPYEICLGIEFLGPKHLYQNYRFEFIHDLDAAIALVKELGPYCGLVFDTFHWYCSGGSLDGLAEKLKQVRLVNVHINDATAGRQPDEQLDNERAMPLETGLIDAKAILAILRSIHYDGPVMVEPFRPWTDRFKTMPPEEVGRLIVDKVSDLFS